MMMESDQAVSYKDYIAGVFSRAAADYDQVALTFFTHFGRELVQFAGLDSGDAVLDVATGRGAALFPAAEMAGQVTGIDIASGMVEETAKEIERRGINNAEVLQMDVEQLEFADGTFDVVLCALGLMFFPNLDRALAEILRVLKPGGQLVASTFHEVEGSIEDRWTKVAMSFKDYLEPMPDGGGNTQALGEKEAIQTTLSEAGFVDQRITAVSGVFEFEDETDWWRWLWSMGNRGFLERLDSAVHDDYRRQMGALFFDEDGRPLPATWHLLLFRANRE
jgi:ubiquinone/menaquinone biosynthesis C-methylase UbiE